MSKNRSISTASRVALVLVGTLLPNVVAAEQTTETLPDSEVLMRALSDEMARSMILQMEDLEKPYFIQYTVDDSLVYQISAGFGAITSSERDRSREFHSRIRVGAYDLDSTNFADDSGGFFFGGSGAGGGSVSLPLDDDYAALRQAMWWASDLDYKDAVETLTKKRAYMKDKNLEDRPADYTTASVVRHSDPTAKLVFDKAQWEANLKRLSGHFKQYPQIQESSARLIAAASNTYIINSEGTQLRTGEGGALLLITAELQASDGMKLSNGLSYYGESVGDFPAVDKMLEGIDTLVKELQAAVEAPILESYTGPVLFDRHAAGQMFRAMLSKGVAGQVDPVGTQRRSMMGPENLENKLGQRMLPRSFRVYDDPTIAKSGDDFLMGHYTYDEEGVQAERVDIVTDGVLNNMAMSRVPTKKLSGSNGHARRTPSDEVPKAAIGSLFIESSDGVAEEDLKARLLEAVKEEGLEFGIRVSAIRSPGIGSSQSDLMSFFMSMREQGPQGLGDPILVFKVYPDGREEMVRGCEFGQMKVRDLKDIIAAGNKPAAYNYIGLGFRGTTPPTSIISPAVLFEELELAKIEQEHDKLPLLKAPIAR